MWYHLLIHGCSWPIRDPRPRATENPKPWTPELPERGRSQTCGRCTGQCRQHSHAVVNVTGGRRLWDSKLPAYSSPRGKASHEGLLVQARGGTRHCRLRAWGSPSITGEGELNPSVPREGALTQESPPRCRTLAMRGPTLDSLGWGLPQHSLQINTYPSPPLRSPPAESRVNPRPGLWKVPQAHVRDERCR